MYVYRTMPYLQILGIGEAAHTNRQRRRRLLNRRLVPPAAAFLPPPPLNLLLVLLAPRSLLFLITLPFITLALLALALLALALPVTAAPLTAAAVLRHGLFVLPLLLILTHVLVTVLLFTSPLFNSSAAPTRPCDAVPAVAAGWAAAFALLLLVGGRRLVRARIHVHALACSLRIQTNRRKPGVKQAVSFAWATDSVA